MLGNSSSATHAPKPYASPRLQNYPPAVSARPPIRSLHAADPCADKEVTKTTATSASRSSQSHKYHTVTAKSMLGKPLYGETVRTKAVTSTAAPAGQPKATANTLNGLMPRDKTRGVHIDHAIQTKTGPTQIAGPRSAY